MMTLSTFNKIWKQSVHQAYVKNLMKKLSDFNTNFPNPFRDVSYYRNLES